MEVKKTENKQRVLGLCAINRGDCTPSCEWWYEPNEHCALHEIADSINWIARHIKKD